MLLPVVVDRGRAALFFAVEVLHLLEGAVGSEFHSMVLDKVKVSEQSGNGVKVSDVSDGRKRESERAALLEVPL